MPNVISVNISTKKGEKKAAVESVNLVIDFGVEGDAHAQAGGTRQVSLLGIESIEKMKHLGIELSPGDFGENITTEGIDLFSVIPGTKLICGNALLEITQIGKKCHGDRCEIFRRAGECIMPKEGVFAKVLRGGIVRAGDVLSVYEEKSI